MGSFGSLFDRPGEQQQRQGLTNMGQQGQAGFQRLGGELDAESDYMRRIARGEESVSAEQLRQGLQKNMAQQQSMAAGASPQNSAMAALNASRNAMQAASGLSGQQALAGIQERQAAQQALTQALLARRQQDQGAAQFGYGNIKPGDSWMDRFGGAVKAGMQIYAMRPPSGQK